MALLKRWGLTALLLTFILFLLYQSKFPYGHQPPPEDYTHELPPQQEVERPLEKPPSHHEHGFVPDTQDRPELPTVSESANAARQTTSSVTSITSESAHVPQPSAFKWSDLTVNYPVKSYTPLPSGKPSKLPRVQTSSFPVEDEAAKNIRQTRLDEVKKAFERCWASYKEHAWMRDELEPISGGAKDTFGGWAASLIDSLDTLWIMGLKDEFREAVAAAAKVDFTDTPKGQVNVFETTIRHLGGLLAAYDLSGEKILLQKAIEVGEMLYVAFDTPNRMPITRWEPESAKKGWTQKAPEKALVAEVGSLSMEFTRLSQVTGDPKYYDAVARITNLFYRQRDKSALPGLFPVMVNPRKEELFRDNLFTLGGMADSLYEYFPKTFALLGGLESSYEILYKDSMKAAINYTMFRPMTPDNADILVSGSLRATSPSQTSFIPEWS